MNQLTAFCGFHLSTKEFLDYPQELEDRARSEMQDKRIDLEHLEIQHIFQGEEGSLGMFHRIKGKAGMN